MIARCGFEVGPPAVLRVFYQYILHRCWNDVSRNANTNFCITKIYKDTS